MVFEEGERCILTSKRLVESPFLRNRFKILSMTPDDRDAIVQELRSLDAGQVLLRMNVEPKEYWKIRKKYEAGLGKHKRIIHLFKNEGRIYLCEKV